MQLSWARVSAKVTVGATILWPSRGGFRPFAIHNEGSGLTRQMIGNNRHRLTLAGGEVVPHAHRAVAGDIAFVHHFAGAGRVTLMWAVSDML